MEYNKELIEQQRAEAQFMENILMVAQFHKPNYEILRDLNGLGYAVRDVSNTKNVFNWSEFRYHTDWNSLMKVIQKISLLGYGQLNDKVHPHKLDEQIYHITRHKVTVSIETMYASVVDFIKWYNENKK